MSHLYLSAHRCLAFWYELRGFEWWDVSSLEASWSSGLQRLVTGTEAAEGVDRKKMIGD